LCETARRPGTGDDPVRRIYVAGYFDTRERLRPFVARLREMGHEVVSRWMDEPDGAAYATSTEAYLTECAIRDLEDIQKAEVVLVDTIDETPRGGREFEAGFAHAIGRVVYIVGPARNVFHRLVRERWDTWDEAFSSGRFGDPNPSG